MHFVEKYSFARVFTIRQAKKRKKEKRNGKKKLTHQGKFK